MCQPAAKPREMEMVLNFRCQKDIIRVIWWGGAEELVRGSWRMTVFVICLLTSQQTAIGKKENSLCSSQRRKSVSQTFLLLRLLLPKTPPSPKKMKKDQVAVTVREQT